MHTGQVKITGYHLFGGEYCCLCLNKFQKVLNFPPTLFLFIGSCLDQRERPWKDQDKPGKKSTFRIIRALSHLTIFFTPIPTENWAFPFPNLFTWRDFGSIFNLVISYIAFQTQHLHWSEWHWYHSRIWWIPAKFKMVICISVNIKVYWIKSLKSELVEKEKKLLMFVIPVQKQTKPWKQSLQTDSKCICNSRHKLVTCYFVILSCKFCCIQDVYKESVFHIFFLNMTYMQHMSCLPWTAGPWTLSPPHRALLCLPAELAKATIKSKPQAKVNSPCWWHLGWWPCQRWRRGKL